MLCQSSSAFRPSSVMRIRSTVIIRPPGTRLVSVTGVASPASIRQVTVSDEKPYARTSTSSLSGISLSLTS